MKKEDLPKNIPIFPLSNFIIFPHTTVPLNIFEPRYIEMINHSMKTNKFLGLIQPKKDNTNSVPQLYKTGCLGKITNCKNLSDGRYLIELSGISRFKIIKEIENNKPFRECEINFEDYKNDLNFESEKLKFSDLELIFKDLKLLFEKRGFIINWKELEKQSLDEIINALAMASPFTLEEKQVLLEAKNLEIRKTKISEILTTYTFDQYNNTTVQ